MKKVIQVVVMITVLFTIWGVCGYVEQNYTRSCEVYEVNGNIITVEDNTGELWDFEAENDEVFETGEKIILKMNTNCTDSYIYDDYITGWKRG